MKTGEGKTLTATLPIVLNTLAGDSVHLVTVNDYLARRDAEWMKPIYDMLGVSVGILQSGEQRPARSTTPTPPTSPTARTPSSASTTCATTSPTSIEEKYQRGHSVRDRRRGRQHPDRRGAHAADHLGRARAGRRPLLQVREAGAAARVRQEARGHRGEVEGVRGRLRLRARREAQDRRDHRAGRREGREVPRHREPLPRRARQPRQPPDPGAQGRVALPAAATSTR